MIIRHELVLLPEEAADKQAYKQRFAVALGLSPERIFAVMPARRSIDARGSRVRIRLLADVYVEEEHRGQGLSKAMIALMMEQPWVSGLRRLMLATRDAHGLYEQYGFSGLQKPERLMEISRPNMYQSS